MYHVRLAVAIACGLVASSVQLAAQGFDGVMWFSEYKEHLGLDTLTQSTKGTKTRFGTANQMALVSNGTIWFNTIPEQKKYVIAHDFPAQPGKENPGKPVKTGKTETVLGIPCEYWHFDVADINGAKHVGDACLAKGAGLMVGRLPNIGEVFGPAGIAYLHTRGTDVGVMKVVIDGKVVLEAIKKQPGSLPDALFVWPADYTPGTMANVFSHH